MAEIDENPTQLSFSELDVKQRKVFVVRLVVRKDMSAENDAFCPVRYPYRVQKLKNRPDEMQIEQFESHSSVRGRQPESIQKKIAIVKLEGSGRRLSLKRKAIKNVDDVPKIRNAGN